MLSEIRYRSITTHSQCFRDRQRRPEVGLGSCCTQALELQPKIIYVLTIQQQHLGENVVRTIAMDGKPEEF